MQLGLALALAGVGGFYLYLGSFFIALMQLLIYVGAITIAIVFACETSTDRVTAVDPTFSGATLIVVPTIESADRSVPCAGPSTATTTIQIPPEFRGRPLTVTVGRP